MKDLPRRSITAILFAACMIGGISWCRLSFSLLLLIIQSGCLYEYVKLTSHWRRDEGSMGRWSMVLTVIAASIPLVINAAMQTHSQSLMTLSYIIPLALLLLVSQFFFFPVKPWRNGVLHAAAVLYIALPMVCWYALADDSVAGNQSNWFPDHSALPLSIMLLIWANDTFAYFTGSLLGRHKILPAVSPKKSWEGFFGGLLFAMAAGWLVSRYFSQLTEREWLVLAVIVSVMGTAGDFLESFIKRKAGVKDSGNILPGHGGFLDRFDALIFCLPFVTLYLTFFA